ncbi:four helix bundle protein [Candidatus Peregrinibacteria bacterium]|nr:four helix bundle protein [Candidatus Peregrinibacteria bacterium]
MNQTHNVQQYDLELRTLNFTKRVIQFINLLPKTISNIEIIKQLVRSSGSVGANYIEANEALSKKDFIYRVKISKKESKESKYWLSLLTYNEQLTDNSIEQRYLVQEATELMKIFGAIIEKSK